MQKTVNFDIFKFKKYTSEAPNPTGSNKKYAQKFNCTTDRKHNYNQKTKK